MNFNTVWKICLVFTTLAPMWTNGGIFSRDALYTPKDDVILVNITNFKSIVYERQHAWIFQFFNQWCGHCVKFSKTYIQLASMVKPWSSVISVGALDCADSANLEICKQFDVVSFPTLKLFPVNMSDGELGEYLPGNKEIDSIKREMITFVSSKAARPSATWPNLLPITDLNERKVWDYVPSDVKHAAVILENNQSYMGREIILDALELRKVIRIFRADINISNFKTDHPTDELTLKIVNRKGDLQIYVDKDNAVSGYVQYLEDYAANYTKWSVLDEQQPPKNSAHLSSQNTAIVQKEIQMDPHQVYLQDIENVFKYMFWQEVALHHSIEGEKLAALKAFTSVLSKYLPARRKFKSLLCHLHAWLDEQKDQVTSTQLQNKLSDLQVKYKYELPMKNWTGCKGSQTFYRGYPCGLWTTFHTLTVNNYHINGKDEDFNAVEVLSAIRGYVMNFFSCERCVKHFTKMSEKVTIEVDSPDSSVLWLWQAHNKVNARLKGDDTEDPFHPKQQFPTDNLCSNCRQYSDETTYQWNLNEVLEFLLNRYSEKSIMASAEKENLNDGPVLFLAGGGNDVVHVKDTRKESVKDQHNFLESNRVIPTSFLSKWGLGTTDVSLCIFLYIASILLLFICYFYILTRRRSCFGSKKRLSLPCNF